VLRLLYAWTPEEYVHACQTIAIELEASGCEPRKAKLLRLMMGQVRYEHPLKCLSRWAPWARKRGIPRPSNAIEGRHSHLKRGSRHLKGMINPVVQLIEYCQTASRNRNANLLATLRRNWNHIFPSEEEKAKVSFNEAKWAYYQTLHTLRGHKAPDEGAQLEPDLRLEAFGFRSECWEEKVNLVLPPKWRPKPDVGGTEIPERQTFHASGTQSFQDFMAWQILGELRDEHPNDWAKIDTSAFAEIVRLGSHLEKNPERWYDPTDEAAWRIKSRQWVDSALDAAKKSAPKEPAPKKSAPKEPTRAKSKSSH
jgi:hypothetical protein